MARDSLCVMQAIQRHPGHRRIKPDPEARVMFIRLAQIPAGQLDSLDMLGPIVTTISRLLEEAAVTEEGQFRVTTEAAEVIANGIQHSQPGTDAIANMVMIRANDRIYVSLFVENRAKAPVYRLPSRRSMRRCCTDETYAARGRGLGICLSLCDGMMATVTEFSRIEFAMQTACRIDPAKTASILT